MSIKEAIVFIVVIIIKEAKMVNDLLVFFFPRIVFLLTDGQSNHGGTPFNVATAMKDSGIVMFTVGLGTGISVAELDAIASTPTDEYRYLLDQLTDVESLANKLKGGKCHGEKHPFPTGAPESRQTK